MKTNKNKIKIASGSRIKLQLDYRTIIYVSNQQALEMWMGKYPGARILES